MLFIAAYTEYFLQFKKIICFEGKIEKSWNKKDKICEGAETVNQVFGKWRLEAYINLEKLLYSFCKYFKKNHDEAE